VQSSRWTAGLGPASLAAAAPGAHLQPTSIPAPLRSLLNKLGIAPSTLVVACTGLAVLALIIAGVQVCSHLQLLCIIGLLCCLLCWVAKQFWVTCRRVCRWRWPSCLHCFFSHASLLPRSLQMRFLLHAPLQLASVLFAASSTTEVCGRFFASNTSLGCMGAVSLMQLSLGVFIPGAPAVACCCCCCCRLLPPPAAAAAACCRPLIAGLCCPGH